jgi:hypothetical protein
MLGGGRIVTSGQNEECRRPVTQQSIVEGCDQPPAVLLRQHDGRQCSRFPPFVVARGRESASGGRSRRLHESRDLAHAGTHPARSDMTACRRGALLFVILSLLPYAGDSCAARGPSTITGFGGAGGWFFDLCSVPQEQRKRLITVHSFSRTHCLWWLGWPGHPGKKGNDVWHEVVKRDIVSPRRVRSASMPQRKPHEQGSWSGLVRRHYLSAPTLLVTDPLKFADSVK